MKRTLDDSLELYIMNNPISDDVLSFVEMIRDNNLLFYGFHDVAFAVYSRGGKTSAMAILAHLRFNTLLNDGGVGYKINNCHAMHLAKVCELYDHRLFGFFRFRKPKQPKLKGQ